jgi:uncharacterized membrane protein
VWLGLNEAHIFVLATDMERLLYGTSTKARRSEAWRATRIESGLVLGTGLLLLLEAETDLSLLEMCELRRAIKRGFLDISRKSVALSGACMMRIKSLQEATTTNSSSGNQ